jgi:hypothetical protein
MTICSEVSSWARYMSIFDGPFGIWERTSAVICRFWEEWGVGVWLVWSLYSRQFDLELKANAKRRMERIPIISLVDMRHARKDESCRTGVTWNVDGVIMRAYWKFERGSPLVVEALRFWDIVTITRCYT